MGQPLSIDNLIEKQLIKSDVSANYTTITEMVRFNMAFKSPHFNNDPSRIQEDPAIWREVAEVIVKDAPSNATHWAFGGKTNIHGYYIIHYFSEK